MLFYALLMSLLSNVWHEQELSRLLLRQEPKTRSTVRPVAVCLHEGGRAARTHLQRSRRPDNRSGKQGRYQLDLVLTVSSGNKDTPGRGCRSRQAHQLLVTVAGHLHFRWLRLLGAGLRRGGFWGRAPAQTRHGRCSGRRGSCRNTFRAGTLWGWTLPAFTHCVPSL